VELVEARGMKVLLLRLKQIEGSNSPIFADETGICDIGVYPELQE